MNNNITEDYCSFEVSQLILKKGGDFRVLIDKMLGIKNNTITHALAIKWVRENFGIHIHSEYMDDILLYGYGVCVIKTNTIEMEKWKFKTSEEATEAALKYTLQNLIS